MSLPIRLLSSAFIIAAIIVSARLALQNSQSLQRANDLNQGRLDPVEHADTLLKRSVASFPVEWTETASLVSETSAINDEKAIRLLETALAAEPNDPGAWALLAFLRTRQAGSYSQAAEEALDTSIQICPLCSKSLLRWRLTFVLQHWVDVSEQTRLAVFSGADLLRWWHLDYEYLAKVRTDALARGIEYDVYRRKVDTPIRSNELGAAQN